MEKPETERIAMVAAAAHMYNWPAYLRSASQQCFAWTSRSLCVRNCILTRRSIPDLCLAHIFRGLVLFHLSTATVPTISGVQGQTTNAGRAVDMTDSSKNLDIRGPVSFVRRSPVIFTSLSKDSFPKPDFFYRCPAYQTLFCNLSGRPA